MLAQLHHPRIVRYVAHGTLPNQCVYLAMEWLDGEDLRARLTRAPLTPSESIALAKNVAEALGAAHARGIVHRDITPGNIFLGHREIAEIKVLDFGIARWDALMYSVTGTGLAIGTPGYMAPEQVRCDPDIDARADVFALGCVLFECLTGRAPFADSSVMAILAKIAVGEPPRVRDLRDDVPRALDELVSQMLAKTPSERPADGAAVARALAGLEATAEIVSSSLGAPVVQGGLTQEEQRVFCVLLLPHETGVAGGAEPPPAAVRKAVDEHGGRLWSLIDGTRVVLIDGLDIATDQAAHAARCALAIHAAAPSQRVALAMGRGFMGSGTLSGEVIERATRLATGSFALESGVFVDEVAGALLDTRFDVVKRDAVHDLRPPREAPEIARTRLGNPAPFVARARAMPMLDGFWNECVSESVARVVLVTASAGIGKSSLRREWVLRRSSGSAPTVLLGRGDPMRAGAPFGLVAPLIREACGMHTGEAPDDHRKKLLARVERRVSEPDVARVAEFLGEVSGARFDDAQSAPLRAARQDSRLMGDQIRRAWEDWLAAECGESGLLLVLEDLHWGDRASLGLVDASLRYLHDRPFMVLALARPEVHETFPELWRDRGLHEIGLGELTRKACERMIREALGSSASTVDVERLISRSGGNAFCLEEIVRAASEGRTEELPGSVLAMAAVRLETLDPSSRKVLRAASVFGRVFWERGVRALLADESAASVRQQLVELLQREVITRRGVGRFTGEDDLIFRHDLMREGCVCDAHGREPCAGAQARGCVARAERRVRAARSGGALRACGRPCASRRVSCSYRAAGAPRARFGWNDRLRRARNGVRAHRRTSWEIAGFALHGPSIAR